MIRHFFMLLCVTGVISVVAGLLMTSSIAQPNTPFDLDVKNYQSVTTAVDTFTVTVKEGTYRIFIYHGIRAGGITAIKIK